MRPGCGPGGAAPFGGWLHAPLLVALAAAPRPTSLPPTIRWSLDSGGDSHPAAEEEVPGRRGPDGPRLRAATVVVASLVLAYGEALTESVTVKAVRGLLYAGGEFRGGGGDVAGAGLLREPRPCLEAGHNFSVSVTNSETGTVSTRRITGVAIVGNEMTLILSAAVKFGDAVTLDYTPRTNPIQDFADNAAGHLWRVLPGRERAHPHTRNAAAGSVRYGLRPV